MKDLPKYKITIDPEYSDGEDLGISMIAFTKTPAIMTKGFAFSSQEPKQLFFADNLKYRICAPVMIPMDIYRFDNDEEYYVQFSVEEIDLMHKKFMATYSSGINSFNLEHNTKDVVPAYILETWIVEDPKGDKAFTTYGLDVPVGTLMMTSQITDVDTYNKLVENKQTGYSIEGFLGLKLSEIKQKFNNMNNQTLNLPAGEYTDKDGNVFVVAEDGTITSKEAMGLDTPPVEANPGDTSTSTPEAEKKKEEEMIADKTQCAADPAATTDPATDPATTTPPAETTPVDSYTKEEVDAKFDEIYKLIASMQAEDDAEETTIEETAPTTQMSVHDRFSALVEFSKHNRV